MNELEKDLKKLEEYMQRPNQEKAIFVNSSWLKWYQGFCEKLKSKEAYERGRKDAILACAEIANKHKCKYDGCPCSFIIKRKIRARMTEETP